MINAFADHLYESMLEELHTCAQKRTALLQLLECSFQICSSNWGMLRARLEKETFADHADEIAFFKIRKPLFISEMEYFGLRYHAQLFFEGVTDPAAKKRFLEREALRLKKFIDDNQEFYSYYRSEKTELDGDWFVRQAGNILETSHDRLVSTLHGLERYHGFIQTMLDAENHNSLFA